MASQPGWFKLLFPYVLWPLGNISITASVLLVVFVSVERYLAICRPLQYKPGNNTMIYNHELRFYTVHIEYFDLKSNLFFHCRKYFLHTFSLRHIGGCECWQISRVSCDSRTTATWKWKWCKSIWLEFTTDLGRQWNLLIWRQCFASTANSR